MPSFATLLRLAIVGVVLLIGSATLRAAEGEPPVVGWRTDARGVYPRAKPPVSWSTTRNVVWKTPMPGRSYGSPILVGDRLFVVSDPAELLCLNPSTGEILWRQSNSAAELLGKEAADKLLADWNALSERKQVAQKRFNDLRKEKPDAKAEHETAKMELEQIERAIGNAKRSGPVATDRGSGNTAATPVSDGNTVYACFGTGIVAAYTLEGKRKWMKFMEGSEIGFGHSSSPALAGDRLIVHYHDLVAINTADGSVAWRTPLSARHSSPVVVKLGDATAILSPSGNLVQASDGKVLVTDGALRLQECSFIATEGVVYAQGDKTTAFRLPVKLETTALEQLWQTSSSKGRRTPSPVLHDGLLYGATTDGILDVSDATTGSIVYRKRLELGESLYSSVTAAGGYIFLCSTKGTTVVFKAGREYEEVARNDLESMGSNPVFHDRRIFLRGQKNLYCIGE